VATLHNSKIGYTPDLRPSASLAYLVGALLGDGRIRSLSRTTQVQLRVKDKEFAQEAQRCFFNVLGEVMSLRWIENRLWDVGVCSKRLGEFLMQPLEFLEEELIRYYPEDFLRGFFDAEGYIRYRDNRHRTLAFYNTNPNLIDLIDRLLDSLGIDGRITHRERKPYKTKYQWASYNQPNIIRFYEKVGSCIPRKQNALRDAAILA
jgi:intein-encoded DNA endonuclease-like protein